MSDLRAGLINRSAVALIALLALLLLPAVGDEDQRDPVLEVVPGVQMWRPEKGEIDVRTAAIAVAPEDEEELNPLVALVQEEYKALTGRKLPRRRYDPHGYDSTFCLRFAAAGYEQPAAGYCIEIGEQVIVEGSDYAGVYNATRTLLQVLMQSPDRLPCGTIRDVPGKLSRVMALDAGAQLIPVPLLQDYARIMGWLKMNELHLYRCRISSTNSLVDVPGANAGTNETASAQTPVYDAQAMQAFVSYAALRGVSVRLTPGKSIYTEACSAAGLAAESAEAMAGLMVPRMFAYSAAAWSTNRVPASTELAEGKSPVWPLPGIGFIAEPAASTP